MASKISRKLGLGGRLLALATGGLSRLGEILADLHANDVSVQSVVNAVRSDEVDLRGRVAELVTLANQIKAKHNALDAAVNASGQQANAADAGTLQAQVAQSDATINTSLVD